MSAARLADDSAHSLARSLFQAERDRRQTRAVFVLHPEADLDDAYRVQDAFVALRVGEIILGGSFIRPVEVGSGDTIVADDGPFGTVSCYVA